MYSEDARLAAGSGRTRGRISDAARARAYWILGSALRSRGARSRRVFALQSCSNRRRIFRPDRSPVRGAGLARSAFAMPAREMQCIQRAAPRSAWSSGAAPRLDRIQARHLYLRGPRVSPTTQAWARRRRGTSAQGKPARGSLTIRNERLGLCALAACDASSQRRRASNLRGARKPMVAVRILRREWRPWGCFAPDRTQKESRERGHDSSPPTGHVREKGVFRHQPCSGRHRLRMVSPALQPCSSSSKNRLLRSARPGTINFGCGVGSVVSACPSPPRRAYPPAAAGESMRSHARSSRKPMSPRDGLDIQAAHVQHVDLAPLPSAPPHTSCDVGDRHEVALHFGCVTVRVPPRATARESAAPRSGGGRARCRTTDDELGSDPFCAPEDDSDRPLGGPSRRRIDALSSHKTNFCVRSGSRRAHTTVADVVTRPGTVSSPEGHVLVRGGVEHELAASVEDLLHPAASCVSRRGNFGDGAVAELLRMNKGRAPELSRSTMRDGAKRASGGTAPRRWSRRPRPSTVCHQESAQAGAVQVHESRPRVIESTARNADTLTLPETMSAIAGTVITDIPLRPHRSSARLRAACDAPGIAMIAWVTPCRSAISATREIGPSTFSPSSSAPCLRGSSSSRPTTRQAGFAASSLSRTAAAAPATHDPASPRLGDDRPKCPPSMPVREPLPSRVTEDPRVRNTDRGAGTMHDANVLTARAPMPRRCECAADRAGSQTPQPPRTSQRP